MVRFTTYKRGDLVEVEVNGKPQTGVYWYKSCAKHHVVFVTDTLGECVRFFDEGAVELVAISQPRAVTLPEWAR